MNYEIYNCDTISFIGGSYQVINLDMYDIAGQILEDIIIDNITWSMCRYGESEALITKVSDNGINIDGNTITIILSSLDTTNFSGFFMHQISIIDGGDKTFNIDLGKILIKSKIK